MNKSKTDIDKAFNPQAIERKWQKLWEGQGYYRMGNNPAQEKNFCIFLPPPNVTGTLHMGHGFNQTLMDTLIRYNRMCGHNTLWQAGTDHAGIATQIVVERQLDAQGIKRHDLGRDAFIEKVWEWKAYSGNTITEQMRKLGTSPDWERERFTMDEGLSRVVTKTFVQLYREGLIYQGRRLVNWDVKLQTAVSDLEVESQEEDGFLVFIDYPLLEPDLTKGLRCLTIATTRPETLLGDTAIMVHPEDERYQHLIGKFVHLPLCSRTIPIIADSYVDKEFGTGVVKVTPAHDSNDYQVGHRHLLMTISIFDAQGKIHSKESVREITDLIYLAYPDIDFLSEADCKRADQRFFTLQKWQILDLLNHLIPQKYQGLDKNIARQKIEADLENQNLLRKKIPHKLMVPRGDRTNEIIEPMLTKQWFVAMNKSTKNGQSIAQRALQVVEEGKINFYPENWINTYRQWLNNIQDWCISRQLWWGHQIPAWYGEQGQVWVAENFAEAKALAQQAGYQGSLKQDEDVLDTWYSSALWPFSTLDWTGNAEKDKTNFALQHYLPSSVLVTGFDIIFFWVARMVMMTLHFTEEIPFYHIYVHGLIRDSFGQKMSKSKGNVLDPIDLIEGITLEKLKLKRTQGLMNPKQKEEIEKRTQKEFPQGIPAFGTDALRFTFASLASPGRDIKFDLQRCEGYQHFCNKLWNATRFVLMNIEEGQELPPLKRDRLNYADRWIMSCLQKAIQDIHQYFAEYRFDFIAQVLYQFVWDSYCDWYVEMAKVQIKNAPHDTHTQSVLVYVLEAILRLAHPIIPFITEELWQVVSKIAQKSGETIMLADYPQADREKLDKVAENQMMELQAIVSAGRQLRSEMKISPASKIPMYITGNKEKLQIYKPYLLALIKLSDLHIVKISPNSPAPTAILEHYSLLLDVKIDRIEEKLRLDKEIGNLQQEITKCQAKLANVSFVQNAPQTVVIQERERLISFEKKLLELQNQMEKIKE